MTDDGSHPGASDRAGLETQIADDVRALNANADRLERTFARLHAVSYNDLDALRQIIVAEKVGTPMSSGDLRRYLGVSAAAVTYLVDRMIAAGHVRREADSSDRRRVILRYSDHGAEVAREFFRPMGTHAHRALSHLPGEDLLAAHRVMTAMSAAMHTYNAEVIENATP